VVVLFRIEDWNWASWRKEADAEASVSLRFGACEISPALRGSTFGNCAISPSLDGGLMEGERENGGIEMGEILGALGVGTVVAPPLRLKTSVSVRLAVGPLTRPSGMLSWEVETTEVARKRRMRETR
jgi:hypothetical protein